MTQLADVMKLEAPRVRTNGEALLACSECHVTQEFDRDDRVVHWPAHCGEPMSVMFSG